MGKAIYCDRCGELFNTSEVECYKIIVSMNNYDDLKVDFCQGCRNQIESFLYGDELKKQKKKNRKNHN